MIEPEKRFLDTLDVFTYRARRVEAHSLAADKKALLALAQGTLKFEMAADGSKGWMVTDLPAEEAMESLASRCRPFVLEGDTVHYASVLNALGYYVQKDTELATVVREQRQRWTRLRRDQAEPLGYISRTGPVDGDLGAHVNDRDLAYRWLYGDLIHADDLRESDHGLTSRYEAGVLLTANIAVRAITLLNVLRAAQGRRLLTLPARAFHQEVTAETTRRLEARLAMAPVGTPVEALEALLDSQAGEPSPATKDPVTGSSPRDPVEG